MLKKESGERNKKTGQDSQDDCKEQYRILFETSSDAIMILDGSRFLDCNPATLKMFGMSKEEFTSVHPSEISPPKQANGRNSRTEADRRIAEAFERGYNKFEWIHRRSSGEDFPATVWLTAFTLEGRQVLQATVRDITEQKAVENALVNSESRLRNVWDSVQVGIVIIDTESRKIFDINSKALDMIGTTREKIIGKVCHKFICPSEEGKCPILDLGQEADSMERTLLTAKGEEIPILKSVSLFNMDGREYILDSFEDISHQKTVEAQLEEYKEHLEDLVKERTGQLMEAEKEVRRLIQAVETSVNAVAILDIDMNIAYANIALSELLETRMNTLMKANAKSYVKKDYLGLVREKVKSGLAGEEIDTFEIQVRTSRGNTRWVELVCSVIYDDGGEPEGIMAVIRDITEKKKILESLTAAEDKYRLLVERANDGILIIQDGKVKYMNPALVRLSGYTNEEQMGRDFLENVAPEKRDEVRKLYAARMSGEGVPGTYETLLLRKDGSRISIEVNAAPMEYNGKPADFVYLRDLTERKKAEAAIKENEQFLDSIFESIQDGISVLNPDLTIRHVNDSMAEWYSSNAPLEGKKCFECYHNKKSPCEPCPSIRSMKTGKTEMDIVPGLPGSELEWVELYSYPIRDPATGEITGIVEFVRDITERKKAERAINESEEKYRKLVETANDAIFLADAKTGKIIDTNRRAEVLIGRSREEIIGMSQIQLHPRSESKKYREIFKRHIIDGSAIDVDVYALHKNGHKIPVSISTNTFEIGGRQVIQSIFHDLTARVKAEEALRESEERFRILANTSSAAIFIHRGGELLFFNRATEELSGYSADELRKLTFLHVVHPDFVDDLIERGKARLGGNDARMVYEIKIIRKDREERWINLSSQTILFQGEKAIIVTAMDINDNKKIQQELKTSEERLQGFFNSMIDLVFVFDREGRFTFHHSPDDENLYLRPGMFLGKSYSEVMPPDVVKMLNGAFKKNRKGKTASFEYSMIIDNKPKWFSANLSPIMVEKEFNGSIAVVRDITFQKEAEKNIQTSEKIYRSLYESTIALADTTDLKEVISVIAEHARTMLGGLYSTIYLWNHSREFYEPFYTNVKDNADKFMGFPIKPGEGLTGKVALQKKGEYVNFDEDTAKIKRNIPGTDESRNEVLSIIAEPLIVEDMAVGVINVVAEKKKFKPDDLSKMEILAHQASIAYSRSRNLEALTRSEGLFRRMTENIHDGLTIIENGAVIFVNDRACEIHGYPREELMKMTHLDTIIPEDREQMRHIIENASKTGIGLGELEFWIQQKNGNRRYVRTRISTSRGDNKTSEFIITTDITERKLAEDEAKRKRMKFLLEDGRAYLVKEFRPDISLEAFKDLMDIDYAGIIISRTPEKDIRRSVTGAFEHIWLGHRDEEEELFDSILSRIKPVHGKLAVLIDRLDYLIFKHGFRETLAFLYALRDTAYMREMVVILTIDPSTIGEEELNLMQKELNEIEQRRVPRPSEELFEIVEKIYEKNSSGIKPSFSEMGAELKLSKPTFRKRVRRLIANGYAVELTKGNKKVLELTQKGRSLFFK